MANYYKIQNIFTSVQDSDFPYLNPENVVSNGGNVSVLVTPSVVQDTEGYVFSLFLAALEIEPEVVDNFGFASYKDDKFSGHCPAWFGIRDGQMGLLIGAASEKFNSTDVFVPCEVEEKEIERGKRKIKQFEYTLNGTPIELIEQCDNDGKSTGKFFIKLTHLDEFDENIFTFPFLLNKKDENGQPIEYAPIDITRAWKTGEFASILRTFGTGGNNIWLSGNKAFTLLFKEKIFPKSGVLILAKNGKYKFTPAGSHANITNDIHQSDWTIVSTSHPELLVQYYDKEKNQQFISLGEATNIQFSNAKVNNEGFNWLDNYRKRNGVDEYEGMVLIHIIEPSKLNVEHMPVNTVTNILPRVLNKLQPYPHMRDALDVSSMLDGHVPGIKVAHSMLEYQQAKDDLSSVNYPTRPSIKPMPALAATGDALNDF